MKKRSDENDIQHKMERMAGTATDKDKTVFYLVYSKHSLYVDWF